jgi:hypothetical protein
VLAVLLLVATLPPLLFASGKKKDFPLHVHIVRVDIRQVDAQVLTDPFPFLVPPQIYTVHIDGDPRELTTISNTFGLHLHMGNYNGHWNTNGSLEIQYLNKKGKLVQGQLLIKGERLLPPEPPTK